MKAIDIIILLKKISIQDVNASMRDLSEPLSISVSSVSESMERCKDAGLIDNTKKIVNTLALKEFLIYGIKYVFPAQIGRIKRGVPTYISASPMKEQLASSSEVFVWPSKDGIVRGQSVQPLYSTIPEAASNDEEFYKLLVIVDTLRIGGARERTIATKELEIILDKYNENKH